MGHTDDHETKLFPRISSQLTKKNLIGFTYFPRQCAAVMIQSSLRMLPEQKYRLAEPPRSETTQGHVPGFTSSPPTIRRGDR